MKGFRFSSTLSKVVLVMNFISLFCNASLNVENMHEAVAVPTLSYRGYVQKEGWQDWVSDERTTGTTGQRKRLEAIEIKLQSLPGCQLGYRVNIEGQDWSEWVLSGTIVGTIGKSKKMHAIQMRLRGECNGYDIYYRAHVAKFGWLKLVSNGLTAGTIGQNRRMEALQITLSKSVTSESDSAISRPYGLMVELMANPDKAEIFNPHPALSWIVPLIEPGDMQRAYQVIISTTLDDLINDRGDTWNSEKVISDSSVAVEVSDIALVSHHFYYWKVKTWNLNDIESRWSSPQRFRTGEINSATMDSTPLYSLVETYTKPKQIFKKVGKPLLC